MARLRLLVDPLHEGVRLRWIDFHVLVREPVAQVEHDEEGRAEPHGPGVNVVTDGLHQRVHGVITLKGEGEKKTQRIIGISQFDGKDKLIRRLFSLTVKVVCALIEVGAREFQKIFLQDFI